MKEVGRSSTGGLVITFLWIIWCLPGAGILAKKVDLEGLGLIPQGPLL